MKITRRKLAVGAIASAAALAQTPPPAPDGEEELTKAAREQVRRNAGTLSKFPLSMATEPAFQFKA
jgi:hypothetical protein